VSPAAKDGSEGFADSLGHESVYSEGVERPAQITFRGMSSSPAVEARVREKIAELEQFFDRIIGCHVVVALPEQHSRKGNLFEVQIELSVPGGPPIVVGHRHHDKQQYEDVYVALRDAFKAAKRQLQDHSRKLRGQVKAHEVPTHGRIWHLVPQERYGFIMSSDKVEIFFHENALVEVDYDDLEVGAEVRYVVHENEGEKGPQASSVSLVGSHHLQDPPTSSG
jgi:ribosomal subunit interface protein